MRKGSMQKLLTKPCMMPCRDVDNQSYSASANGVITNPGNGEKASGICGVQRLISGIVFIEISTGRAWGYCRYWTSRWDWKSVPGLAIGMIPICLRLAMADRTQLNTAPISVYGA